jgi:hypothetical protein
MILSQIKFYNHYVSSGYDKGEGIVQLPDSSYVVCGSSTGFQDPSSQAFFMKIDSVGNHKWAKQYGGSETETAKRIFHTPGEGFYAAGHTNATTTGDFDFYFFHTDENGDLLWEKKFGTQSWDILNDAIKLPDSSYILIGDTYNPVDGEKDGYMVRINKFGDTLWTKRSNYLGEDILNSIDLFYDTAFNVAGKIWNADSNFFKGYLASYHLDGTLIWEKQFGGNGNFEIKSISKYNGEILAVGNNTSFIDNSKNDYGLKVSSTGVQTYFYVTESSGDHAMDVIAHYGMSDGFIVSNSFDNQFTTGPGQDLYFAHYNNYIYTVSGGVYVSGNYDDFTGQIIATSDNGAIVVGTNNSVIPQTPSVFVLKIGQGQDYPNTLGTTPQYSLVSIIEENMDLISAALFPNPANEKLTIQFANFKGKGEITFTNMLGKIVDTYETENGKSEIDISNIEEGIYLVKIKLEDGSIVNLGKTVIR